jgi:hypothetical protein
MVATHEIIVSSSTTGEPDANGRPTWFVPVMVEIDGKQFGADVYFDATGTIIEFADEVPSYQAADWWDGAGIVANDYATEAEVVSAAMESGEIVPHWDEVDADQLLAYLTEYEPEYDDQAIAKRVEDGPTYWEYGVDGDWTALDDAGSMADAMDAAKEIVSGFSLHNEAPNGCSYDVEVRPREWADGPTDSATIDILPDEPDCTKGDDAEHDWEGDGLAGSNGGTSRTYSSHCRKCGMSKTEYDPGSQRNPGDSATVEYGEPDAAWVVTNVAPTDWPADLLDGGHGYLSQRQLQDEAALLDAAVARVRGRDCGLADLAESVADAIRDRFEADEE